jgi:hypothetical protein
MEPATKLHEFTNRTWAERMRREARTIVERRNSANIDLARRLWAIFNTPTEDLAKRALWNAWGYTSITEFDRQELGIHPKHSQRLRRICWKCVDLRLPEDFAAQMLALGLAKAVLLSQEGVMTRESAVEWVTLARSLTVGGLRRVIRDHREGSSLPDSPRQPSSASP